MALSLLRSQTVINTMYYAPALSKLCLVVASSGVLRGVWLGTACSTWSRALRGPLGSAWAPVRDGQHIWG
eukprot:5746569-Lingulodinium_polyedra.AAC.1